MIHTVNNKANKNIIKLGKDILDPLDHRHKVDKINCNSCPSSYIEQTGQSVRKSMYQHGYALTNSDKRSVLFKYYKKTGYTFDFKSPQVLDAEISRYKREFSEMLHIHAIPQTLNRKTDLNKLQYAYGKSSSIIRNISTRSPSN